MIAITIRSTEMRLNAKQSALNQSTILLILVDIEIHGDPLYILRQIFLKQHHIVFNLGALHRAVPLLDIIIDRRQMEQESEEVFCAVNGAIVHLAALSESAGPAVFQLHSLHKLRLPC